MRRPILLFAASLLSACSLLPLSADGLRAGAVELVSQRNETSRQWLNQDGTLTAEICSGPLHYRAEDGSWRDIDTTLQASLKDGYGYCVLDSPTRVYLSATADGWQAVEVGDLLVEFRAEGTSRAPGIVDGNTITYPDAWPGVDLRYTVTPRGLKEDIILKRQPPRDGFTFVFKPCALSPVPGVDGSLVMQDSLSARSARIAAPFLVDARAKSSWSVDASWESRADGSLEVRLVPDQAWLAKARYPVVLDPPLSIENEQHDVAVDKYFFDCAFGSYWVEGGTELWMGQYDDGEMVNTWLTAIQYSTSTIDTSAVVTGATIKLTPVPTTNTGGNVQMHQIVHPWATSTTAPVVGQMLRELQWSSTTEPYISESAALTQTVQSWVRTPSANFGVRLRGTSSWPLNYRVKCYSSEYGDAQKQPKLFVDYVFGPEDWPMFMHDAQHTGASKTWDISGETLTREWAVDLPTASTERTQSQFWSYQDGPDTVDHPNPGRFYSATFIFPHPYIDSSPVVTGNKVVVGTWTHGTDYPFPGATNPATGTLRAFEAASGTAIWTATGTPPMGGVASTPCIADGRVYVGTTNGYLYCLDLNSGSQVWARQTTNRSTTPGNSPIISSPVVHDGVVYITNEASKVYAFTADNDGTPVFDPPVVLPVDQPGHGDYGLGVTDVRQRNICGASSPAIATVGPNTYLLVGCDDGYFYRIRLSDRTIAELNMGGCVESSPSVSGNSAYIGVTIYNGDNVRRVSIEPFAEIGAWSLVEESRATCSLQCSFVYNGVDTGHVFYKLNALDPAEGVLASFAPQSAKYFVGSAAHTAGGIVYTGNDDGHFYALDADDLAPLVAGGYYDPSIQQPGFICSSPAIGYNVDCQSQPVGVRHHEVR